MVFPKTGENSSGGRPSIDYHISLDMAKELSMVERNEKGKQARQYFIECERRAKQPSPAALTASQAREVRLQTKMFAQLAADMGLEGNQALLSVCRGVNALTGVNPMGVMGVTHMDAPEQEALLNASSIGLRLHGLKAAEINKALTSFGFQNQFRDHKGRLYYEPTEKGLKAGAVMQDTGKKHDNGTPVRQLRWASGVVNALRAEMGAA